jgi:hypothetical protein
VGNEDCNETMKLLPLLLLLALPAVVQAQFTFTTNNGAITITGYTGSGEAVTIPSSINFLPVTSIGNSAFFGKQNVTSVSVPDSATQIGNSAFYGCTSLTNVTIGNSVTNIGNRAFYGCTKLAGVYFRGNATSLGLSAFASDPNATIYYLPGTTGWGPMFGGRPAVLWNPPVPFSYTTNNGTITITGYTGSGGAVTIPSSINFLPVTSIWDNAFYFCFSLTNIAIPSSITNIGNYAFYQCTSLIKVTIPDSVTSIGNNAFNTCSSLGSVIIPTKTISIRSNTFAGSGLTNFVIPDWVTNVEDGAFFQCFKLISLKIGSNITSIANGTFSQCGLTSITIPNHVTSIGDNAFYECNSLTNATIGNSVTSLGQWAFSGCFNLPSVTIPNSVTNIGVGTFSDCYSLTNVTIGNRVTSIGQESFQDCPYLKSITIPDSVTSIGMFAFYYDISLNKIIIGKGVTNIASEAFENCHLTQIYFPGNAPTAGYGVFNGNGLTVFVYYLPGTTGWGSTFSGRPTVLWNPQPQTSDQSFGVHGNQFGFNITGSSNLVIVVEGCTNLSNPAWQPVQTNTLTTGSAYFSDPQWTNYPGRFYRLRSP